MFDMLWNLLAVLGIFVCFMLLVVSICAIATPKDRREEDEEQMNYLRHYFNRKDDNND